jgi:O-antigen/teichoic acid export membrane protein
MATSLVVARLVGPSVLGTIAFGLAYVNMFTIITDLGFGTAHIKLVSEGRDIKVCNGTYATIKASLIGIFVLVFLGFYLFQKFVLHSSFESETHETVIFIYLVIITLTQFYNIYTATWAARMEQAKQDIPSFLQTLIYQILRIVLAVLGYKAIGLVLGNLASILIIIPFYLYLGRDLKFGKFDKSLFKDYLKIAAPTIVTTTCGILIYSTDKVILQSFTNSEELGFYSAAFVLGSFIKTIEGSTGMLLFPLFSKYISERNYQSINNNVHKFERFSFSFILPMAFTIAIFSDLIIQLTYGDKFTGSVPIFSIILLSFMFSLSYLPYGNILFGMGLYKLSARSWLYNIIVFWVSSYFLVSPDFLNMKGIGMAIAIVLTTVTMFIQMLVLVRKHNKEIVILPGKKILFFSLAYFGLMFYLHSIIPLETLVLKLLASAATYFIFLGIGAAFKIIRKEEFLMIFDLLNISKMKSYIGKEIMKKKK